MKERQNRDCNAERLEEKRKRRGIWKDYKEGKNGMQDS